MKILQIIQRPQLRGAEIFACQLSEELVKLGHHVDILFLFEHTSFDLNFDLNFIQLNANQNRRFWDFSAYKKMNDIIRLGGYDVVQANAGDTLKYAALSKRIHRWSQPLIFRNANKMGAFIRNVFHKVLNNLFLAQCNYIISVSNNCRTDLISIYPPIAAMSETITIGTYDYKTVNAVDVEADQPVFINIGSFVLEKNHTFLLEIFKAFRDKTNVGKLWLIGDGILKKQIQAKVSSLELDDHVKFWGFRKDVISILKSANLMLMPSRIEGLPGVILEALSCGIPVVASDIGGISEVIKDNVNGYCIQQFESALYVDRMEDILTNPVLYEKMSKQGQELIFREFLMTKIADKFQNAYKKVIL